MNNIWPERLEHQNRSSQALRRASALSGVETRPAASNKLMLDSLARDENIPPVILANKADPQEASSSMQDVARRLVAAIRAEGYGTIGNAGE